MSGVTTTYTSTAVITEIGISKRVVPQNPIAYECPAFTVAKVSGTMVVDNTGSAAKIALGVQRGGTGTYFPIGAMAGNDEISSTPAYVILDEGDIITSVGNNGANTGTADIDLTVQEVQNSDELSSRMKREDKQRIIKERELKRKKETKNVRNK